MSFLFGSKPKVQTQSPQAALDPTQQGVENTLARVLNLGPQAAVTPYQGPYAAPLSPQENTSLAALEQSALSFANPGKAPAGSGAATLGGANQALQGILSSSPQDFEQYYQDTVTKPALRDFQEKTLPALEASYGRSAGGAYGSDRMKAENFATRDLTDALVSARSGLAFQTGQQNVANKLSAAQLAPGVGTAEINPLVTALSAAGLPRQVQQTELTGQYSEFQRQQNDIAQRIAQMLGFLGTPTQFAPNTVVNPGQPGLLQTLGPAAILAATL